MKITSPMSIFLANLDVILLVHLSLLKLISIHIYVRFIFTQFQNERNSF